MSGPDSKQDSKKITSSVHDPAGKPAFGGRFLTDPSVVFTQNAWDHVPPPPGHDKTIAAALERQRKAPVSTEEQKKYNDKPARYWDEFYKANEANFFKDRKWLQTEFAELVDATKPDAGSKTVVEIGCGAGNAVFPILALNKNSNLRLHAYDYSPHAVKLVQRNPLYAPPLTASVWDLTSTSGIPSDLQEGTVDVIVLVFVLSALHPREWKQAVSNIHKLLKPKTGIILLRDYGRHDLTQIRFRGGRLLEENLYIRGDKTRVYFFERDELSLLFTGDLAQGEETISTNTVIEDEEDSGAPSPRAADIPSPSSVAETPSSDLLKEEASTTSFSRETYSALHSPMPEKPLDSSSSTTLTPSFQDSYGHSSVTTPGAILVEEEGEVPNQEEPEKTTAERLARIHPSLLPAADNHNFDHIEDGRDAASPSAKPLFTTVQLGVDRRLLVNRKRELKMYRVWMQGKFHRND